MTTPTRRVKHLAKEINERCGTQIFELLSVSATRGVIPRSDITSDEPRADDLSNYKICRPGDIVVNRMSAYQGALGSTSCEGIVSPDYLVLRPSSRVQSRWLHYLMKSSWFVSEMSSRLRGIGSIGTSNVRTPRVSAEEIGEIAVSVPTFEAQRAIANYLDTETARIDALITKKQQLVELLQLKRRALVENTLTQGTMIQRKMRVKYLLLSNDGGTWGDEPDGVDDVVVLRSTDISLSGDWRIEDPALRKIPLQERDTKTLAEGDLVVVKSSGSEAHLGKTAVVSAEVASMKPCFANFVQRLRLKDKRDSRFLWYFFNSPVASKALDQLGNTTTGLRNLNAESIGTIECPWPSAGEREIICRQLDRASKNVDAVLDRLQTQVQLLTEKRQALITAAVTGELEVPGVAA